MIFYYIIKPCGSVIACKCQIKAQFVARFYNTTVKLESDLTLQQIEQAEDYEYYRK